MTNFTKEQILQHYKNAIGRLNSRKVKSSEMNQDDWFIATTNITKFMPTNRSLSDRLFALDLDLTTNPQCKVCGVNTNYVRAEVSKPRGFRVYCSQLCASKDKKGVSIIRDEVKAAQKRKDTMIEKYGYEFNSQRPEVNVKSRYSDLMPLEEVINDGWCRVFDCGNRVYIKYKIGDIK